MRIKSLYLRNLQKLLCHRLSEMARIPNSLNISVYPGVFAVPIPVLGLLPWPTRGRRFDPFLFLLSDCRREVGITLTKTDSNALHGRTVFCKWFGGVDISCSGNAVPCSYADVSCFERRHGMRSIAGSLEIAIRQIYDSQSCCRPALLQLLVGDHGIPISPCCVASR